MYLVYTTGGIRRYEKKKISKRLRQIDLKTAELEAKGYREAVITGIEIASYGKDLPGKPDLITLLEAICQAVPQLRVRLGSLEPRIITRAFCEEMAVFSNLC